MSCSSNPSFEIPWLLGEQWPITKHELAQLAASAGLVLAAPTSCQRSTTLESVLYAGSGKNVALDFRRRSRTADGGRPKEDGTCFRRLAARGWLVEEVPSVESSQFVQLVRTTLQAIDPGTAVVVDITGLPLPALGYVARLTHDMGHDVTWVYAEPRRYRDGAATEFASGLVDIGSIKGFASQHSIDDEGALVLFAGYDSKALQAVANYRKGADPRFLVIPFPPLQAQMYQESIIQIHQVQESVGVDVNDCFHTLRVPAFDAMGVMSELIRLAKLTAPRVLSVAPLSTKAHALGVFLWWASLDEDGRKRTSIVAPRFARLEQDTSEGLGRIWTYRPYAAEA